MRDSKIADRMVEHVRANGPTQKFKLIKAVLTREPNGEDYRTVRRAVSDGLLTCDETGLMDLPGGARKPLVNTFEDDVMETIADIGPSPATAVLRNMGMYPSARACGAIRKMIDTGELRECDDGKLIIAGDIND